MRPWLRPALALALLGVVAVAQMADAMHPRPKGATPVRVSLVPAYKQCTAPNRTHGPPIAFPSCAPPAQSSTYLTVGSPDANGAGAKSVGFVEVRVDSTPPSGLFVTSGISDVRCLPGTAAAVCTGANAEDGPDYSGELQATATIRITDHRNGPGINETATVVDIPFPVNLKCENTADTAVGGACSIPPSTVQPAFYPDGGTAPRSVIDFTEIEVLDGGADGRISTQDNTRFEIQGLFIP